MKHNLFSEFKWGMKLKLFPILFSVCFNFIGQVSINTDSLNYYFTEILNQHRTKQNLKSMKNDILFQPFTKQWSNFMSKNNYVGHGVGGNSFQSRLNKTNLGTTIRVENCSFIPMNNWNPNYKQTKLKPFVEQYNSGEISQFGIALLVFYTWWNSPPHYEGMMNPVTTKFYVSFTISPTGFYFSYLGTD